MIPNAKFAVVMVNVLKIAIVLTIGILAGIILGVNIHAMNTDLDTKIDTLNIVFIDELSESLNEQWEGNKDVEFDGCLDVNYDGDNLIFTSLSNIRNGFSDHTFDNDLECEFAYIHSHPKGTCRFSFADIWDFNNKPNYFNVLMCGEGELIIASRNNRYGVKYILR